jgi:hypothetical protein
MGSDGQNCGSSEKQVRKQVKVACRPEGCRITIRRRSLGTATIIYCVVLNADRTIQALFSMKHYIYFSIIAAAMLSIL